MPTGQQDNDFAIMLEEDSLQVEVSAKKNALDNAIWWIDKNLDPEDVFSTKKLESWAEAKGYVKQTDNA